MILETRRLWIAETNTYVIAAQDQAVIVDAPPDPEAIAAMLVEQNLVAVALLLTHGHIDHVGGAGPLTRNATMATYVHPDDDFLTLHPEEQLRRLFGMVPEADVSPPAERLDLYDGQRLELGGYSIETMHTPGHTPGHCCFFIKEEGILFSGDHLFAGSIGRTDLPGGDLDALMRSMEQKVLPLPDDTIVYPGHGPATTLARERLLNPFLQGFSS